MKEVSDSHPWPTPPGGLSQASRISFPAMRARSTMAIAAPVRFLTRTTAISIGGRFATRCPFRITICLKPWTTRLLHTSSTTRVSVSAASDIVPGKPR